MRRNSFGEFYGRYLKALGGASIYDNIIHILMRTNFFVFNFSRKKTVLITLRTLQLLLYCQEAYTKYPASAQKKKTVRTRRACIKIQTAKNLIKLPGV